MPVFVDTGGWFAYFGKRHDQRAWLKKSIAGQGLKAGDVGTVIHVYKAGEAFEIEFLTPYGETVAIATSEASQLRPVQKEKSLTRLTSRLGRAVHTSCLIWRIQGPPKARILDYVEESICPLVLVR
jgi:hypothetical protein